MRHLSVQGTRAFALSVVAIAALAGTAVPGWAATSIAGCPFAITAPGNYIVTADLNCTGDAIDISASNVSVNLNGHIITGPGADTSPIVVGINIPGTCCLNIGPSGRLNHVAIEGPGLIQNFSFGVWIGFCDFCQMSLVTAAHNGNHGLSGLSVNSLTVRSNVLAANRYFGMVLGSSVNGVIAQNDLSGNGYDGLDLIPNSGDSVANTVNNNTVNGNLRNGIRILAKNSRIYSNVTDGNGAAGIVVELGYSGNQIFNNTSARGNVNFDLEDDNSSCGTNVWSDNVFFTRSLLCVH